MKWFAKVETLEDLKKQYRKLVLKFHPDVYKGADAEQVMKQINAEYETLFGRVKNIRKNAKGETYCKETTETPEEFRNIISGLAGLTGIEIEICGDWVWITGNTKQHKETLKALKFRWSGNKKAWYYHNGPYIKKRKKGLTMNEIRDLYGSQKVEAEQERRKALA